MSAIAHKLANLNLRPQTVHSLFGTIGRMLLIVSYEIIGGSGPLEASYGLEALLIIQLFKNHPILQYEILRHITCLRIRIVYLLFFGCLTLFCQHFSSIESQENY